jgi:hypothetical protein
MERDEITRRFAHHPPRTEKHVREHEAVRGLLTDLAHDLNDILPDGREKSLALTKLEETGFHAHSALARARAGEPDPPEKP